MPHGKAQQYVKATPPGSGSDQQALVNTLTHIWDILQQQQSRLERDIADVRQQHSILVSKREEENLEVINIMAELSALKQRLSKIISQAEGQLHNMERASVPGEIQKQITQLQTECNWIFTTVNVPKLFYYSNPSTLIQPSGYFKQGARILVLYKITETNEGLWCQIRVGAEPDKRYWIRLLDSEERVTIGQFDVKS